jgi:hypothetical protein
VFKERGKEQFVPNVFNCRGALQPLPELSDHAAVEAKRVLGSTAKAKRAIGGLKKAAEVHWCAPEK